MSAIFFSSQNYEFNCQNTCFIFPSPQRPALKTKKRKEKKNHSTQDSHVVPHHGTSWAAPWLTAQIRRDAVLSESYGRGCMECTFRKPVNNISISTYERSFKRKGDQTSKGRSFSSCIAPKPPAFHSAHHIGGPLLFKHFGFSKKQGGM